ncbi:hypothetical protein LTS08_004876 [Lithohypha guttulata]|uniref:endo-1,3(4)-beta-glucanase n=1 Tax=Lithohypha guttulata TaxID=1690604 RepID=A0AAN7YIR6_9EURO|nr:hypothetical protein LTR51_005323 [Lithohypha guttulata]KAK5088064.1 hypothetical protein LTR05_002280 [Lithohypha guttulata]KAK5101269.1 hypothetical protein LTS08_004876 [Lithohypha guttulata]
MRPSATCFALGALLNFYGCAWAAYTLKDDYSGDKFFGMFDFFTEADPTHGYVDYISQSAAQSAGLINNNNNQVYMGVDTKNIASGRGRKSVRLTSKAVYNHGLIILDLEHMPGSVCGTWPAFWTVGPDWPNSGEIDIIEGVNSQTSNSMALHTGPGCSIASNTSPNKRAALFSGSVGTPNCDVKAPGQAANAGCSIKTSQTSSYGSGFNAGQGGVYATEWTSNAISIWYFPRNSIPSDINSSPDPSTWGIPLASFTSTSCDIDSNFKNQQIVFDTTFCGDWAGNVWSTDATCSSKAPTCQDFVQNNPTAFTESFWTVNSLKVFTGSGGNGTSPSASRPASSAQPTASRPPVSGSSGLPTALPSGTAPPIVPSSVPGSKPSNAPSTTFATSKQTSASAWNGGGYTRTWSRGGGPRAKWNSNTARDIVPETSSAAPEPTVTSVPELGLEERSAVLDQIEADQTPSEVDQNMVRRHMARHKRHGGHFGK